MTKLLDFIHNVINIVVDNLYSINLICLDLYTYPPCIILYTIYYIYYMYMGLWICGKLYMNQMITRLDMHNTIVEGM